MGSGLRIPGSTYSYRAEAVGNTKITVESSRAGSEMLRKAHHNDGKYSPNRTVTAMEKLERYETVTKEVNQFLDKKTVTTILGAAFISSLFVFAFDGNVAGKSANPATAIGHSPSNTNNNSVSNESAAAHEENTEQVKYVLEEISSENSFGGSTGSDAAEGQLLDIQLLSKNFRKSDSKARSDRSNESITGEATNHASSLTEATPHVATEATANLQ